MNATRVTRRRFVWGLGQAAVITCFGAQAIDAVQGAQRAGIVSYIGEQQEIFKTGRASARVSLGQLAGLPHLYAIGPVEGLDGEITIFNSEPHVSKVRAGGDAYIVDRTFDHGAIFLVWAQVREWNVIRVPQAVSSYRELETVVREMARQNGIDTDVPFPFLIAVTPHELVWHVNVDRTEGKAITPGPLLEVEAAVHAAG